MKNSGWRKPTPGLCEASRLAEDGERLAVSKNQAMLAVRRVAPAIGLKASDLMLLDTLVVFTKPCDWEEGQRPIVWPSNEYLVENTGYSQSAVKRHLRRLAEAGLIAYKDSTNGKRWGRRDEDGRIIEAYGFDLSPLATRAGEFEALYASIQAERGLVKAFRRKITICRRVVWAILQSEYAHLATIFWSSIRARYEALLAALRGSAGDRTALSGICEAFGQLKVEAEEALRNQDTAGRVEMPSTDWKKEQNSQNMNTMDAVCEPHIQTTNDLQTVNRNSIENAPAATSANKESEGDRSAHSPGRISGVENAIGKDHAAQTMSIGAVTVQSVLYACPVFAEMAHAIAGHVRNWRDLVAVADKIRPSIGISGDAWAMARNSMSMEEASVAIALITDKYSEGALTSPGGYLRGLSQKARKGDLHLARSVFGRLNARGA